MKNYSLPTNYFRLTSSLQAVFLFLCFALLPSAVNAEEELFLLSSNGSGRATAYEQTNKIVTSENKTHVAWLNSDTVDPESKSLAVQIRTLNHKTNKWSETYTIGHAYDNHGGPALAIDSKGFLHAVYHPHHGPMHYRKSIRPNDASEWGEEILISDKLTYPALVVGPDNTLYLVCRRRNTGPSRPWEVQLFTKKANASWSEPQKIIQATEGRYSQFQTSLAWGPNHKTLHLTARIYGDSPRWGSCVGYMKSLDFGKTWQTYTGKPIALPATRETIDSVVATPHNLRASFESASALRGGAIAIDKSGIPHILYSTLKTTQNSGSNVKLATPINHIACIAKPDGKGGWKKTLLNEKFSALPKSWGLGLPGGLVFSEKNKMYVTLTMSPEVPNEDFWARKANEVIMAESTDQGQTFKAKIISKQNPNVPNWLPNIERPTGHNVVKSPCLIFTSGIAGSHHHEQLENKVYFWGGKVRGNQVQKR